MRQCQMLFDRRVRLRSISTHRAFTFPYLEHASGFSECVVASRRLSKDDLGSMANCSDRITTIDVSGTGRQRSRRCFVSFNVRSRQAFWGLLSMVLLSVCQVAHASFSLT